MKLAMMVFLFSMSCTAALAVPLEHFTSKPILADLRDLQALGFPVLAQDDSTQVGYTLITPVMQQRLQERAHSVGKCGGFEDLTTQSKAISQNSGGILSQLAQIKQKNDLYTKIPYKPWDLVENPAITAALARVQQGNLQDTVTWLSSYPSRYNHADDPNKHVVAMQSKLQAMLQAASLPYAIDLIDHQATQQKTVRVRLVGSQHPDEIVVLGAHLDSINQEDGDDGAAPGADDNASGSADLIEALRIMLTQPQPQRTVEFFWYAGEESGLLGSAEISDQYQVAKKDVIAVLQLDMTLFPGSGELVIGNMTDFTSSWLRDYLKQVNDVYIHARLVDSECGYGCSDHASWYRHGYPTIFPFEATMDQMNGHIHTADDTLAIASDFTHSQAYARLALVFAMDLANSTARQPY